VFAGNCLLVLVVLAGSLPVRAQDASPDVNAPQPDSREAQIAAERAQKAQDLKPDVPSKLERRIIRFQKNKLVEDFLEESNGFGVAFGGLVSYSGFAVGPQYTRRDIWRGRMRLRASARASAKKYYRLDFRLNMPELAGNKAFFQFYTVHNDYPRMQYYGPGPKSAKTGRSDFRFEDTSVEIRPGVKPLPHLRAGLIGSFLAVNVGPGTDPRFVSTEKTFSPAVTPGIDRQTSFWQTGGFLQFDYRNYPGEPTRGGNYLAQYSVFTDRDLHRHTFNRLDLEVQQYIPFFQDKRVIALRAQSILTDAHHGQVVPFYLQPVVGGSETLRGFRPFRFYDDNAIILNGEYRWEVFSGLDMALFADGGKVFHDWRQWNLHHLEASAGFGFRFNVRNNVFLRIDTGFSREGFRVWFKFNNVF
jgi:outer membrane protein assembly factor BamA